jgi:hypothetical protein
MVLHIGQVLLLSTLLKKVMITLFQNRKQAAGILAKISKRLPFGCGVYFQN